jgi:hypothetical protein
MLKKSASRVLAWRVIASLRGSTYGEEYASPPRSLRPRWTAFLTILRSLLMPSVMPCHPVFPGCSKGFSTAC